MAKTSLDGLFRISDSVADKMASQIAARIFKKHALDNDLRSIFCLRILPIFRLFLSIDCFLQIFSAKWGKFPFSRIFPLHDSEIIKTLEDIGKREFDFFVNDLEIYKRKNREPILETIKKAKNHNQQFIAKRSIFKLVQWDKNFLSHDFIHKEIAVRQFLSDSAFYERLSDVVRKKSSTEKRSKEKIWIGVFKYYLHALTGLAGIEKKVAIKTLFEISEGLYRKDLIPEALSSDYEYFRKYLKRHRVI